MGEWTACRLRRQPPAGVLIQLLFFQTMTSPYGVASRRPCAVQTRKKKFFFIFSPVISCGNMDVFCTCPLPCAHQTDCPTCYSNHPNFYKERMTDSSIQFNNIIIFRFASISRCYAKALKFTLASVSGEYLNSALHSTELTAAASMGKRGHGEPPPPPISDASHHQSSRSPDHGMQPLSPDKS